MQNDIPMTFLCISENRNRKYNSNMADVRFLKLVVVISQPWIKKCRWNLVCKQRRPQNFFPGGGANSEMHLCFLKKVDGLFSRHPQHTGLHCNYTNAKNTIRHFQRGGGKWLKTQVLTVIPNAQNILRHFHWPWPSLSTTALPLPIAGYPYL